MWKRSAATLIPPPVPPAGPCKKSCRDLGRKLSLIHISLALREGTIVLNGASNTLDALTLEGGGLTINGNAAVSYTHLDVYKRQFY